MAEVKQHTENLQIQKPPTATVKLLANFVRHRRIDSEIQKAVHFSMNSSFDSKQDVKPLYLFDLAAILRPSIGQVSNCPNSKSRRFRRARNCEQSADL